MIDNTKPIRTRFAPSPTGYAHIGTVRTGLFAFLFARHYGGKAVLRVEDTDQSRKIDDAVDSLLRVLQTLGMDFDEGPYIENGEIKQRGDYGPYIQSQRLEIYQRHAKELLDNKKAYYCFCSEQRLADLRQEQTALKQPTKYDGQCRKLTEEEVSEKLTELEASGQKPVIRQMIPDGGVTVNHDLVYGDITYAHETLDDQVLLKSDGFPTYHLAVVVDDHEMQISHVIRADDWLPSTPKHILLYQDFGWEIPKFAHLPLILNPDKTKLSKRKGDVAAEDFLKKGYLPQALVNFIVLLGWNPKTEQEVFSMQELIEQFELSKVNKSGAVFDLNKLDWMNAEYLRAMPVGELVELCKPYWSEQSLPWEAATPEYLESILSLEKDRLKKLSDVADGRTDFYFNHPEPDAGMLVWKKSTQEETKQNLTLTADLIRITSDDILGDQVKLEETIKKFIADHGLDNGSVLWPLRVAMTGLEKSPGPFEVTATIAKGRGREYIMERLQRAISSL